MPDAGPPSTAARLTIAIPTYNRHTFLKDTLYCLLPQLTPECRVTIVDNGSYPPVRDAIRDIWAELEAAGGRIARNPANIGANANVLRCMELCDTEWLWIVSDDDHVWNNAVDAVLQGIDTHPDCSFVSFAQKSHPRTGAVVTHGRTEFLSQVEQNFYTLLFLSTTIYRVKTILPFINYGYSQIPSLAPHMAVMAMASDNQKVYFSEKAIVEYVPAREGGWSKFWVERGLPLLLELPLSERDRSLLQKALRSRLHLSGILSAFLDSLGYGMRTRDPEVCSEIFRMAMLRRAMVVSSSPERLLIRTLLLALGAPELTIRITRKLYPMVKGHSFETRAGCVGISLDDRV